MCTVRLICFQEVYVRTRKRSESEGSGRQAAKFKGLSNIDKTLSITTCFNLCATYAGYDVHNYNNHMELR